MPPIFLIVGAPATGKSTASRALAARFPKSIAIGVDDLRNMVIGGVIHPSAEWSDELVAQLQLARKSALLMARTYHAVGYTVVIDDFYDPYTQMHEYDELVANEKLMRVLLYPNRQNLGRIDAVLDLPEAVYILEFKMTSAQQALQQIRARQYDLPFRNSGKPIYLLGIAFNPEQRNIADWVMERSEG